MVGDFDGFGFAISLGDITVGYVGVAVNAREDRVFQLVHDGIVKAENAAFCFREIQVVGFLFLLGFQLRRKMAEVKFDAAGRFANGEKLDDDRFFGVGEAEEALHRAVPGSHPLPFGRHWVELAFPAAGEPGKSSSAGLLVSGVTVMMAAWAVSLCAARE